MTHINPIHEALKTSGGVNPSSKQPSGEAFEAALNKAVNRAETQQAGNRENVSGLREIYARNVELQSTTDIVSGKTDQLLEMLDQYSHQLGNPSVSLKKMTPVLEKLRQDAGDLLEQSRRLLPQDGELREIADKTALTAQTEYLKFQRGDYTS